MKARRNQSLLDMILQGCGSLEAGMRVAYENDLPISFLPEIDREITISPTSVSLGNSEVVQYLIDRGLKVGTKGVIEQPARLITEDTEQTIIAEDGTDVFAQEEG